MLHPLRPTLIAASALFAALPPAAAQLCGNTPPGQVHGRAPGGPEGPGYRPAPAASSAGTPQGEPAPGFSIDQSGRRSRTYFAVGNEPGWSAEVTLARPRTMVVKTDNGSRTYEIANVRQRSNNWSGTTADGTAIRLNCGPAACQDTMAGRIFPGTASLVVGKTTLRGCGGFRD